MYSFLIKCANVNIVVYGNLMVESNLSRLTSSERLDLPLNWSKNSGCFLERRLQVSLHTLTTFCPEAEAIINEMFDWFYFYVPVNMYKVFNWSSSWDIWYLSSHRRPAKAQASLRIRIASPEPSLLAHIKYGSRRRGQPNIRHQGPLDGCACAFEECIYGGRKVPLSRDMAQLFLLHVFVVLFMLTLCVSFPEAVMGTTNPGITCHSRYSTLVFLFVFFFQNVHLLGGQTFILYLI